MGNFNKSLYIIAITAITFLVINELFTLFIGIQNEKESIYKKDRNVLDNLMKAQFDNVRILSNLISTNEYVIQGYKQNDPEIIKKNILPLWNKVRNEKLTYEIHFFKPPATSFVNFSNFNTIGKDVSDVRTDIEWITTSFKPSTHLLMCKTFAGLRATDPIFDKEGHILGGLSLGKKIDWIPTMLKENSHHDVFLVYSKKSTNSLVTKYYNDFIKDKNVVGNYILANRTIQIPPEKIKEINFSKKIQTFNINGTSYYLNIYPIIDFNKQTMGYVCTLTTLNQYYKDFTTHTFKSFLLVFATAFIIFYITRRDTIYVVKKLAFIEKLTEKIKERKFKALHDISLAHDNNSLTQLQNNIVAMGLELEKSYNFLKEENKEKDQKIFKQLYFDSLTKLPNRNKLFEDLKIDSNSFIALLDIKNFKQINDAFGFEIGNAVLQQVTNTTLAQIEWNYYNLYRFGGDRFIIKNNLEMNEDEFVNFIEQLMHSIENETIFTNDISVSIEMYAGICLDKTDKLEKAEMSLTKAKKNNKEYVVYNENDEDRDQHTKNINMINKIKNCVENDKILVYFQAIVNKSRDVIKYEALVRLQDGETILSPYQFLGIAQKTKYYPSITKTVINKTFEKFKDKNFLFSINLSASDILNETTSKFIKDELRECKNAHNAVFEILESEEIYNLKEIQEFIVEVKALGAKIAIDDFGTGYSNFSYLLTIEPDYLKIDGSLIKNIDTDQKAQKVVKSIITFAKESDILTVAEFVHSEKVFEVCQELGIDEYQGYLFSEPSPTL